MENRILFVAENDQNFLIRAMMKTISDAGYEVRFVQPEVYQITMYEHKSDFPNIFILYLEGSENRYDRLFSYIKQLVSEKGKNRHLFLIGNPSEINTAFKVIPKDSVDHAFQRPVNTEELLRHLNMLTLEYRYDENDSNAQTGVDVDSSKHNVLLVDDDITQLHAMQRWFSKRFNAFVASSGMDTVAFLKHYHVDLILLDYEMPGLSGLDVLQMLRSEPETANIPVIFLTGSDDKRTVMSVLAAKPNGYLLKSMPPSVLVQSVEDFFVKQARLAEQRNSRRGHSVAPYDMDYSEVDGELEEL
ncbi:MAG: response regulator [Treponema sp.]|nr:response regulator [Treponema sp.]